MKVIRGEAEFWHTAMVPDIVAVGKGFTVTRTESIFLQPLASVSVTLNVLVIAGFMIISEEVSPLFHKKVPIPPTLKVVARPRQILVFGLIVMVGLGLTFTITVSLAVVPPPPPKLLTVIV